MSAKATFPRCGECGGEVRLSGGGGRTRALLRRVPLSVPDDFEIPTCTKCGEDYMVPAISEELDKLLGEQLQRTVCNRIHALQTRHGATKRDIEDALRVSRTYLSHIISGLKQPSAMLVGYLDVLATVPGAWARATSLACADILPVSHMGMGGSYRAKSYVERGESPKQTAAAPTYKPVTMNDVEGSSSSTISAA